MKTASQAEAPVASSNTKPARLLSLDLLRGLTIGFMILVNNQADSHAYWPLQHANWNGFTPTDLVFPTFLFLVGISTVLSLSSRLAQGTAKSVLLGHAFRRAMILYLLGIVVNSFPFFHLSTMRFYGVLPRISICYLVVAVLYLMDAGWRSKAVIAVTCLVGYWILMRYVPVPGYGMPTHDIPLLDRDGNLTAWLDRQIFSAPHLYEQTRDPEGLLSTIPALATALLGMLTAFWLRSKNGLKEKVIGIVSAGCACVLLGGLWNLSFPINKKLWTSSFVLFAGGLSLLLLALFVWLVDLRSEQKPKEQLRSSAFYMPLLVFGTNAITAYVFSELVGPALALIRVRPGVDLLHAYFLFLLGILRDPAFTSLVYSISYVILCWIPIYVLYRRKIFIKI